MISKSKYDNKIIYKNSIYSMGYKIISVVLSLISAPLILKCLGDEKYGTWATVLSLISWIYYCDLGIGNGLRNKLASSIAEEDFYSSKKYLGTAYTLIFRISFIVLIFSVAFLSFFDIGKWFGINDVDENIQVCIIVAIFFACINFVLSLINNILFAMHRASLVSLFSCISQILFVLLLLLYSITGISTLIMMALGEGGVQLLKNVIATIIVFKKYPELKFSFSDYDRKYMGGILSFGLQIFLVQIAALVLNSTDNIVITKLFGSAAVTPYDVCFKYFNIIQTMYVALITPLLSAYTAAKTLDDYAWISKSLRKNGALFVLFFVGTVFAGIMFEPICEVWLHKKLYFENGLIICTCIYFILLMFSHIFSTFLTGINCIKETTIAAIIGTIINIPVSILLAKNLHMGTSGVILGSAVSLFLTVLVAPIITIRELSRMRR